MFFVPELEGLTPEMEKAYAPFRAQLVEIMSSCTIGSSRITSDGSKPVWVHLDGLAKAGMMIVVADGKVYMK